MKGAAFWFAVLFIAGCSKPAPLPEKPGDDSSSRTTTAFNAPSTPQEMAEKCDVPMYPGAQAPDDLTRMPRTDADGNTHYELVLTTKDKPKTVADYYAKALKLTATQQDGTFSIVGKSSHQNDLILDVVSEGGQTVVRIHSIAYKR